MVRIAVHALVSKGDMSRDMFINMSTTAFQKKFSTKTPLVYGGWLEDNMTELNKLPVRMEHDRTT